MAATGEPAGEADAADPAVVLGRLPAEICQPLMRAVRRATESFSRSALPGPLRPLAGWRPQRLTDPRARRAVAAALDDARFRAQVAEELGTSPEDGEELAELVERVGAAQAAAVLAAAGRWSDLDALAGDIAESAAGDVPGSASSVEGVGEAGGSEGDTRAELSRLRSELESTRSELREGERRAAAEAARAERAEARAEELSRSLEELRGQRDRLAGELAELRRRYRRRVASLRRRLAEAEGRAVPAETQRREVAERLESLARQLREGPVSSPGPSSEAADEGAAPGTDSPHGIAGGQGVGPGSLPRDPPAADPGRPTVLPPGLSTAHPDGVRAVLRTPGITVLLDGYNVTKDPRGHPGASLEEQRRWLVSTVAGAASRFGFSPVVVFDGAGRRPASAPAARGVRVAFSAPGETADDHIVEVVAALDATAPAAVVTSDRELERRVAGYDVDVVAADRFLAALHG